MEENKEVVDNKMNPEWKEKWIKALRSGEYKQGSDCLKERDRYCCLGVLCDIYGKEKGIGFRENNILSDSFLEQRTLLPKIVAKEVGILKSSGVTSTINEVTFSHMNDIGKSFIEIADFIEKNL